MKQDVKSNWHSAVIDANTTVIAAINQMNTCAWRILLVVDAHMHLLGVITDGDIRRHLLSQASLEVIVTQIMQLHPITALIAENQDQLLMKMHAKGILHLPIVDADNRVVGLETFDSVVTKRSRENWVIF